MFCSGPLKHRCDPFLWNWPKIANLSAGVSGSLKGTSAEFSCCWTEAEQLHDVARCCKMLQERWLWPYCNAPQTRLSKTLRRSRCRSGFWSQTVRLELSCEAFGSCSLDSLDSKLNCLNSVSTLSQVFDTDLTPIWPCNRLGNCARLCHWSSDDAIWGVVVFVSTWQVAEFQLRPFSWLRQSRSCGYSASVQMLQDGCVQFCFDPPMKPLQIIPSQSLPVWITMNQLE